METSDDAFGLLSLDWGGDPITFGDPSVVTKDPSVTSSARALYGAGLLRIWSDTLYARVMASRDTPATKQAVLALGKAITSKRKNPPEPDLLNILPLHIDSVWKLRPDRLSFFRSYLVLNSIYYVSHDNILDLDITTAAVFAPYENISTPSDRKRSQFLLVKYQNHKRALNALHHFHDVYLPEHKNKITADSTDRNPSLFKLEDGWLAYKLINEYLLVVFECPDEESARKIIGENETNVHQKVKMPAPTKRR
jgi:hypothetical protein